MSRVRVVIEPPSDYTRFELAHFPAMAAAGDDIRVIAAAPGTWPPDLPRHDFWLFDDRDVWVLKYDGTGTFLRTELRDDPQTITSHLRWRGDALGQSTPVDDYLAKRGDASDGLVNLARPPSGLPKSEDHGEHV